MPFTPDAGERIVFQGHPSWRAILAFYLKGLVAAVVVALVASLFGSSSLTVFLLVLAVLGATGLLGFAKRAATVYTATDRRLHISRGILSREIQETRLDRVQNVSFTQSVSERILGIGDIDFDTASREGANMFVFAGVADPEAVVSEISRTSSTSA